MKAVTAWFLLVSFLVIVGYDFYVWFTYGDEHTITGLVREWSKSSTWPEFVYVIGVVGLYLHFFRGWPD